MAGENLDDFSPFRRYTNEANGTGIWVNILQVFQRRINGEMDFYRGWDQYMKGFGDPNGEFWLGKNGDFGISDYRSLIRLTY